MHTTEDRRKVVMLRIDRAFPFDSCCDKCDGLNPESTLPAVAQDFYLGKIRVLWQPFRCFPSWLSMPGECNHSGPRQHVELGTAGML